MADRACTRGPVMDTCRSYYLNSGRDDFAEADAEKGQPDLTAVHPTNDNTPMKASKLGCRRAAGLCLVA